MSDQNKVPRTMEVWQFAQFIHRHRTTAFKRFRTWGLESIAMGEAKHSQKLYITSQVLKAIELNCGPTLAKEFREYLKEGNKK